MKLVALKGDPARIAQNLLAWIEKARARVSQRGRRCARRRVLPAENLVHADHEGRAEERRQQIDNGDCRDDGDEKSGNENIHAMRAAHRRHIFDRAVTQSGKFEIAAAEQIGIGGEEDDRVEARHEQQDEGREIDDDGDDGEFCRDEKTIADRGMGADGFADRCPLRRSPQARRRKIPRR